MITIRDFFENISTWGNGWSFQFKFILSLLCLLCLKQSIAVVFQWFTCYAFYLSYVIYIHLLVHMVEYSDKYRHEKGGHEVCHHEGWIDHHGTGAAVARGTPLGSTIPHTCFGVGIWRYTCLVTHFNTMILRTNCMYWGGWFARSNRGIEGSYLTTSFKEDIEQLMLQLSRKGKSFW